VRVTHAISAVAVAVGLLLAGVAESPAVAQRNANIVAAAPPRIAGEYFIEFRARPSTYIGHTYIVYGRVSSDGAVVEIHYAGHIPFKDAWRGLFAPIPGGVRNYIDDTRRTPSTIYRQRLTPEQYRAVSWTVARLRADEREWHAIFLNCNDFAIQIARTLDLPHPPSLLPPSMWVGLLKLLNER
jgi:hypothetical protein